MKIVYSEVYFKMEPVILTGLIVLVVGTILFSLIKSYKVSKKKNGK